MNRPQASAHDLHALPQTAGSAPAAPEESPSEILAPEPNRLVRFFKLLGPGLITGASDDDPSGIGTYATAGASLGVATLWMALLTFPLMTTVQFICAKIAMVTGTGLAGVLRAHYPRWVLYPAVFGLEPIRQRRCGGGIVLRERSGQAGAGAERAHACCLTRTG